MNLDQISRRRDRLGKVTALLCFLFFVTVIDALIAEFRQPLTSLDVLPGTSVKINGQLLKEVEGIQELTYETNSEYLRISFETVHRGFWLGGYMWRGLLIVEPQAVPAEYSLAVSPKGETKPHPLSVFRIKVHSDVASYRQSHKSFIQRHTGFSPWWVIASFIPLIPVAMIITFYLSRKREFLLAQRGMAEIYRVKTENNSCEVSFSLGTNNGVQPGMWLNLCDESGQPLGTVEVLESTATDSFAKVGPMCTAKPGYLVSKV